MIIKDYKRLIKLQCTLMIQVLQKYTKAAITAKYKIINVDDNTNQNQTELNLNWPFTGYRKTNPVLNLISNQPDIDKIYLYAKDPYEAKYQYLFEKREKVGLNHYEDPEAFIECSNDMQDVYKNVGEYILGKNVKC